MNGGIQKGTTASSVQSTRLDRQLKEGAKNVLERLKAAGVPVTYQKKLPPKERDEIGCAQSGEKAYGCEPDGGIWSVEYDGRLFPVASFEGKKQGTKGNADERWAKNSDLLSDLIKLRGTQANIRNKAWEDSFRYKTFAVGEGAAKGETFDRIEGVIRRKNLLGERLGWSLEREPEGFTQEHIEETMYETIKDAVADFEAMINEDS